VFADRALENGARADQQAQFLKKCCGTLAENELDVEQALSAVALQDEVIADLWVRKGQLLQADEDGSIAAAVNTCAEAC